MPHSFEERFLEDTRAQFRALRALAEGALEQLDDAGFSATLGPESNSVAVLVKHVSGNLLSRWTDFLTSDGEKPGRDRDSEFEITPADTRASLMARWAASWECVARALETLEPADLGRQVTIRGEPHAVVKAIHRSLTHVAGHVYQIVLLARHECASGWRTLSVPRGGTPAFNVEMARRFPPAGK